MIEFIPLANYYDVYIYTVLFLVVAILMHAYTLELDSDKNIRFLKSTGIILLTLIILYIGLRPISGRAFGDMGTYSEYFKLYAMGGEVETEKDFTFHYLMKFLSYFVGVHGFFLIISFLYTFPMYLVSKIHFKEYWFYAFIMFVASFSYFTYGTNGIRNGVGTSLFLLALCFPRRKMIMIAILVLSVLIHKTLILPALAISLTFIYNNPKSYLIFWILAIPFSLVLGSVFITIFTSLGFGDDRISGYLTTAASGSNSFRWDFLFYSSFPVVAGAYFIFKQKFNDQFFNRIFNTYLVCNGFWILIIRANFSNRFAYLSWFLMALIIIYPLLKKEFFQNQQLMISKVVTAYFLFTFLMYFIYYYEE